MARKIHNLIILDRSGSMSSMQHEAVASVNETIGTIQAFIKNNPESEQTISLVTFCSCTQNYICDMQPAHTVERLKDSDYQPCCCTPLYDTIGNCCTRLHKSIEGEDVAVSVTIITDGYENASCEWNHQAIKALIERYKKEGWLFAYIGTDHDVESVAFSLSIDNKMRFEKTSAGFYAMSVKESGAREKWMNRTMEFDADLCECASDYFDEDDE